MNLKDQLDALFDATAFDSTGVKIGAVRQVYVDDASGKITFATVSTGVFSADAIVPLHGARLLDGELHVDHTRSEIRDSPRPDHTEDALTPDQEARLLEYYGLEATSRGREPVAGPEGRTTKTAQGTKSTPGTTSTEGTRTAESPKTAGSTTTTSRSTAAGTTGRAAADQGETTAADGTHDADRADGADRADEADEPAKGTGPGPAEPAPERAPGTPSEDGGSGADR